MLWDWLLDHLVSERNRGILAAAAALILGGLTSKAVGWFRAPRLASVAAGVAVAGLVASMYWPHITYAYDDVAKELRAKTQGVQSFALQCGDVGPVLATIRTLESGNQYDRLNGSAHTGATASGAYQYTNGTWNNYGGYRRAMDAPPAVQDERAHGDVTRFLERHGGDVSVIPVLWYIGHVPSGAEWDRVPWASQGNTLTPRQYQTKWLAEYQRQTAACAAEVK